jgi:hypothetical protein
VFIFDGRHSSPRSQRARDVMTVTVRNGIIALYLRFKTVFGRPIPTDNSTTFIVCPASYVFFQK